jgi:hypothetical protein
MSVKAEESYAWRMRRDLHAPHAIRAELCARTFFGVELGVEDLRGVEDRVADAVITRVRIGGHGHGLLLLLLLLGQVQDDVDGRGGRCCMGRLLGGARLEDRLGHALLAPPAAGERLRVIQQQGLDEPGARKHVCEDDSREPQPCDVGLHRGCCCRCCCRCWCCDLPRLGACRFAAACCFALSLNAGVISVCNANGDNTGYVVP